MSQQCSIESDHEFESRSGAMKLFKDGTVTGQWVCPSCVDKIRDEKLVGYQIFVIEGREVVIPTEEIDV